MNPLSYVFMKTGTNLCAWVGALALVWLSTKTWICAGWLNPELLASPYNAQQYASLLLLLALVPTVVTSRSARWLLLLTSSLLSTQSLVFCVLITLFIENNVTSTHNHANGKIFEGVHKMRTLFLKIKPTLADILISTALVFTLIMSIPDSWNQSLLIAMTKVQVHTAWFALFVFMIFSKSVRLLAGFIVATQSIFAGLFCLVLLFAGRFKHFDDNNNQTLTIEPVEYTFDANGVLGPNCSGSRECSR